MSPIRHSRRAVVPLLLAGMLLAGCATDATDTTDTAETTEVDTEAAVAENAPDHDEPADHEWDTADEIAVTLQGDGAEADGSGAQVDGSTVTFTAAGTYRISGTLDDGQLIVDSADSGIVRLVLDGVDVTSTTSSALVVDNAEEVMIVLADDSSNTLTDGAGYSVAGAGTDGPSGALYSTANLTIAGDGALTVTGNSNDGISSNDGLVITGGTVTVDAVDDAVRGKDYVVVEGGTLTLTSGGDGISSDNDSDATMGYVRLTAGTVTIDAGGDGVDAATDVLLSGADLDVTTGGGAGGTVAEDASVKGVKGDVTVLVDAGTVTVDAADDAVHSNGAISVTGGTLELASGDDAVHADAALTVSGGTLTVTAAYEGLESAQLTISGGDITLTTSDDGLNVAGGTDGSGQMTAENRSDAAGGPVQPGGGGGGGDEFAVGDYHLVISGGTVVIDAGGDGLDSNGTVEMTGGTVVVNGPTDGANGAIDVNGTFDISGGVLVAAGSAGMAQMPDASTQATLGFSLGTQSAGTVLQVVAADGTLIGSFTATKPFAAFVLSTPDLVAGQSYQVLIGGSAAGQSTGGWTSQGDPSGATAVGEVTASGA